MASSPGARFRGLLPAAFLVLGLGGCAAMSNPMADGIPVRLVPPDLLAPSKSGEHTIPLTLLRQPQPAAYRLAPGDVLGVYIEGFLGDRVLPMPVHAGPQVRIREQQNLPPALGYPVPVHEDGTIALPSVDPVPVQGLTIVEARDAIRKMYRAKELLRPENERIFVSLLYARRFQVLVFRQETAAFGVSPEGPIPASKRGTGIVLDLPAYENDVLHALAQTGGLPGLDVYNEVIVFRDCFHDPAGAALLKQQLEATPTNGEAVRAACPCARVTRIPLRAPCGQPPCLRPEEVELQSGDVVFLEARDNDLFYTGGLLPSGAHVLPRDRDLDVVQAILLVRGPFFNGAFGGSNLSGALIQPGIGNPSPSLLTVLRRAPDGRQVAINVNLRRAVREPQERILIKSGDVLVLQEQPGEALTRYLTQTFFNFNLYWQAVSGAHETGVVNVATPDRLGQLPAITNFNNP
jgi:protein involved in polysaccharide export with SLBB domain